MNTEKTYFWNDLHDYLVSIGSPEADDKELLDMRSEAAFREFCSSREAGADTLGATEVARRVLTDGVGAGFLFLMD